MDILLAVLIILLNVVVGAGAIRLYDFIKSYTAARPNGHTVLDKALGFAKDELDKAIQALSIHLDSLGQVVADTHVTTLASGLYQKLPSEIVNPYFPVPFKALVSETTFINLARAIQFGTENTIKDLESKLHDVVNG